MIAPAAAPIRRALIVSMVIATAAGGVSALPAGATFPGRNGELALSRCCARSVTGLQAMQPDGTGLRTLTIAPRGAHDDEPDWSPDGSSVLFSRCKERCEIWVARADGSQPQRLGPDCLEKRSGCENRENGAFSPDGTKIAFMRPMGPVKHGFIKYDDLYVMNANGSDVRALTHFTTRRPFSGDTVTGAWSPDGKRIVFGRENSALGRPRNGNALFIVNADGSGLHQLTPWRLRAGGGHPDWSPDGRSILFRTVPKRGHDDPGGNYFTIHPDGKGLKQLTRYPKTSVLGRASYSPDGRYIAFTQSPGANRAFHPDLFVMNADGSNARVVGGSRGGIVEFAPDWGPAR